MSYPRNAASPPRIAIGPVVQISDGAVQTSGVSVKVKPEGGAASAGGGTVSYEEGVVAYVPTQAETDYTAFQVIAYKTGCIPAAVTVVTSASATAGHAGTDQSKIANPTSTVNLSNTTIKTATDVETDTADIQSRIGTPSNLGSGATVAGNLVDIENQTDDIGAAGAGLTALGDARMANLDATVSSRSTLTQAQVTGGAYALNSSSFAFHSTLDLTATQKTSINAEADTALADFHVQISDSVQASPAPTTTGFAGSGSMSATVDYYLDCLLTFTSGALSGQSRVIPFYDGATRELRFDEPLTSAPSAADTFRIAKSHQHSLIQSQAGLATDADMTTALSTLDNLSSMMEADGPVYRFTANSLEQAPRDVLSIDGSTTAATNMKNIYGSLETGTAQAGGPSSITLQSGASTINDYYKDQAIFILSGTGARQTNRITAYNGGTNVATVSTPWAVQPDNTSVYDVVGRIG